MQLSAKHLQISPSLTLAISAQAKEMKARGEDVLSFGAGEPDFSTPEFIIQAAYEALQKGYTRYTPVSGIRELKEAIAKKMARDNKLTYSLNEIIVSNGAKQALYNALQAIINPGEEVIIPVPYWVSYPEMVKMAGGKPVFVQGSSKRGFKINAQDLQKAITKRSKALILNSPNNPTGSVYSLEELQELAQVILAHNLIVISDEIYEKIIYDQPQHYSLASLGKEIKERTIVINGMSKAFAMTGWRIGFAAANKEIIQVMTNIQSHSTSNPNSIAQYASTTALTHPQGEESIQLMVKEFKKRRDYLVEKINSIQSLSCTKPEGAFYILINIKSLKGMKYRGEKIKDSLDLAEKLLKAKKIALVPGKAFGLDDYLRFSYAASLEDIKEGLTRLASFVQEITSAN